MAEEDISVDVLVVGTGASGHIRKSVRRGLSLRSILCSSQATLNPTGDPPYY